jgi:hypothetical protein
MINNNNFGIHDKLYNSGLSVADTIDAVFLSFIFIVKIEMSIVSA